MDNIRGCLEILFKKIPPDTIIKSFCGDERHSTSYNRVNKDIFIKQALCDFPHYSEDEVQNILEDINSIMKIGEGGQPDTPSVFNLLRVFTRDVLTEMDCEPCCRYEHMLRWRMASHKLDQDTFTTAFLAHSDVYSSRSRGYFAWNPIISSDNLRLKRLLDEGLAENHFHLKGSAPAFALSWISLMNNVVNRKDDFKRAGMLDKKLEPDIDYGEAGSTSDFYTLVKKAAVIRAFLFCIIKGINFLGIPNPDKYLKAILTQDDELQIITSDIQSEIECLKYQFVTNTSDEFEHAIDYAIPQNSSDRNNNPNKILTGERYFLYNIYKAIYAKDKKILDYADLFYAYLVIKAKFRAELIQNNGRVGFKNFSDYQDRKSEFIQNEPLLKKAMFSMALTATINNQNIKSLEARIIPGYNTEEIDSNVRDIDKIVTRDKVGKNYLDLLLEEKSEQLNEENKHFYVMHFLKSKDNNLNYNEPEDFEKRLIISTVPRHFKKREDVKRQAYAILSLRDRLKYSSERIFGIDACANEIGCRPEVFAQAFRFLKNHSIIDSNRRITDNKNIPQLRATFHVGEDFLDITDGLRAMDEVLNFLDFSHGDRFGHALALGVDVKEWYKSKKHTIVLSKQDFLDNIVWMLAKIREFNIHDTQCLVQELENEYSRIFSEIFYNNFSDGRKNKQYSHTYYYDAWKLRGDSPDLYLNSGDFDIGENLCYWDRCAVNRTYIKDDYLRNNKDIAYLYYSYHYNPEVKRIGTEILQYKVSENYVSAVQKIQKCMMRQVQNRGIGIETNPSSNYLIGTFKRYDKHPIINFYNLGLCNDSEAINNCPQLFVSINTDDQGVFDTYLENEYALMAISLEKAKDEFGNPLYNQSMIYDWLDRIKNIGLQQSFKK